MKIKLCLPILCLVLSAIFLISSRVFSQTPISCGEIVAGSISAAEKKICIPT